MISSGPPPAVPHHSRCHCDPLSTSDPITPVPWGGEALLPQYSTTQHMHHNKVRLTNTATQDIPLLSSSITHCNTTGRLADKIKSDHKHFPRPFIANYIQFDFNHQASSYLAISDYRLSHTYPNMELASTAAALGSGNPHRRKTFSATTPRSINSHSNRSNSVVSMRIPSLTLPRTIIISPGTAASECTERLKRTKGAINLIHKKHSSSRQVPSSAKTRRSVTETDITFKLCWWTPPSFLIKPTKSFDTASIKRAEALKRAETPPTKSRSPSPIHKKNNQQPARFSSSPLPTATVQSFTHQYMMKPVKTAHYQHQDTTSHHLNSNGTHSVITINSPWETK